MQKKVLLISFFLLSSFNFFELYFFNPLWIKVINFVLLIYLILIFFIKKRSKRIQIKKNFSIPVFLLIIAPFLSSIVSYNDFNQPIFISVLVNREMYFYVLYFLLHKLDIRVEKLESVFLWFGFFSIALIFVQSVVYPFDISYAGALNERNTIRFIPSSIELILLLVFLFLNRSFTTYKTKYYFQLGIVMVAIIFMATKSIMIWTIYGAVLAITNTKHLSSKIRNFLILFLVLLLLSILFKDIINSLLSNISSTVNKGEQYSRIRSIMYYLLEYPRSCMGYILGNGNISLRTPAGQQLADLHKQLHLFQVDIGIVGGYSRYGITFILALIIIAIKVVRIKLPNKMQYLKYYILYPILLPLSGSTYWQESSIVLVAIVLFMIDKSQIKDPVQDIIPLVSKVDKMTALKWSKKTGQKN